MDKMEIEIQMENGIQSLGMAWLTEQVKQFLISLRKEDGGYIKKVGEIKITRTVFSTKIG